MFSGAGNFGGLGHMGSVVGRAGFGGGGTGAVSAVGGGSAPAAGVAAAAQTRYTATAGYSTIRTKFAVNIDGLGNASNFSVPVQQTKLVGLLGNVAETLGTTVLASSNLFTIENVAQVGSIELQGPSQSSVLTGSGAATQAFAPIYHALSVPVSPGLSPQVWAIIASGTASPNTRYAAATLYFSP